MPTLIGESAAPFSSRQSPASSPVEGGREAAQNGREHVAVAGGGGHASDTLAGGEPSPGCREDLDPDDERDRRPQAASEGRAARASSRCKSTRAGGGGGSVNGGKSGGSSRGGKQAAAAAIDCEGCAGAESDERVDKELLEGFGIAVCRACKVGLLAPGRMVRSQMVPLTARSACRGLFGHKCEGGQPERGRNRGPFPPTANKSQHSDHKRFRENETCGTIETRLGRLVRFIALLSSWHA